MEEILKTKQDNTRHRWETAVKDRAYDSIRNRVLLETNAEHFLHVLEEGTVSTNLYLWRIHNFALDMSWLPWPVVPKKRSAPHQPRLAFCRDTRRQWMFLPDRICFRADCGGYGQAPFLALLYQCCGCR